MVINDSLILDVVNSLSKASIGIYLNQLIVALGGILGITLIYFIIVIYYHHKQYRLHQEELSRLDMQLILLSEVYNLQKDFVGTKEKIEEIHNILILHNTLYEYEQLNK